MVQPLKVYAIFFGFDMVVVEWKFYSNKLQVSAKFMGVDMERMEVDLQHLLKLQYEGQVQV